MNVRRFTPLLLFSLFVGCIDEIQLNVNDPQERLVVEGRIADSLNLYSIRIKTAKNNGLYPVSNAKVNVLDDQSKSYVFVENKLQSEGTYELMMKGEVGRSYHVEIMTPDQMLIKSVPTVMLKAPQMSNFSHTVESITTIDFNGNQVVEKNINVKADVLFEEGRVRPFLRWRTSGEYEFHEPSFISAKYCYIKEQTPDLNKLNIYSPIRLAGIKLTGQDIVNLNRDTRFAFMYCFHIQMFSMNEAEYLYWRSVRDVLSNDGTLYDPPPGNVKGNLINVNNKTDQIIGYFSVSGVYTARYFVSAQSLGGNFVNPPCGFGNRNNPPCQDCLVIKNSSLDKPTYWP